MRTIDLNCDMGESFGAYVIGSDEAIMPFISSANIACGFHAGDPSVMERTVQLAHAHGVAVGAHPGYPDLQGFGRRNMSLTSRDVEEIMLYQMGALAAICRANHVEMVHVKPHGALYNQAAGDRSLAEAVTRSIVRFNKELTLFGLAGSELWKAGDAAGLRVAAEGFPDRAYDKDGGLRSRDLPDALIHDPHQVAVHGLQLAEQGVRVEQGGMTITWKVNTLCIHGDAPKAVENARLVREILEKDGFLIKNN
jgi:UPF0271 protein